MEVADEAINLSKLKKNNQTQEHEEIINHLYQLLEYIKNGYKFYLLDLYDLNKFLKINLDIKLTRKIQKQINFALETKSKLINEFEIFTKILKIWQKICRKTTKLKKF